MIAQAAIDPERRAQAAKSVYDGALRSRVEGDKVAGEHDHVGLLRIGDSDIFADLIGGHEGADVNIRKLADAESFEGARQSRQMDGPRGDVEVETSVEQAIGAGNEGRADGNGGSVLQKIASRPRWKIRARRLQPANSFDDSFWNGDQQRDQEPKE